MEIFSEAVVENPHSNTKYLSLCSTQHQNAQGQIRRENASVKVDALRPKYEMQRVHKNMMSVSTPDLGMEWVKWLNLEVNFRHVLGPNVYLNVQVLEKYSWIKNTGIQKKFTHLFIFCLLLLGGERVWDWTKKIKPIFWYSLPCTYIRPIKIYLRIFLPVLTFWWERMDFPQLS